VATLREISALTLRERLFVMLNILDEGVISQWRANQCERSPNSVRVLFRYVPEIAASAMKSVLGRQCTSN